MGNSVVSTLKAAIINNDFDRIMTLLEHHGHQHTTQVFLDQLINRKGDTALMLAAFLGRTNIVKLLIEAGSDVNHINKDGNTAMDLAISRALPPDGEMLYRYRLESESNSELSDGTTGQSLNPDGATGGVQSPSLTQSSVGCPQQLAQIPEVVRILLDAGATGRTLERLILFAMRDKALIKYIIDSLEELSIPSNFRLSGLLVQVAVWFDQPDNLKLLLKKDIDLRHFWTVPFMPLITPSNQAYLPAQGNDDSSDADEYCISTDARTSDPIQELKFSFVHEWWADWNEGENPSAQYRAGLQLTPESALCFVRTSNSQEVLERVMEDVMRYLPPTCAGPDLSCSCLFNCLTMAGYIFRLDHEQHLSLKFNVDFDPHHRFNKQPKKLRYLCRISIRFMFTTNVQLALASLTELPRTLHEFLLLESDIQLT